MQKGVAKGRPALPSGPAHEHAPQARSGADCEPELIVDLSSCLIDKRAAAAQSRPEHNGMSKRTSIVRSVLILAR